MNRRADGKLGLFSCVALIVGACIGSAIFSLSGMTIFFAGPSAVISWVLAALIYGAYGVVVASLSARYPRSGGIFLFPKRAIGGASGSFWGFVSGWGYIVSNTIAIGFSAIYFGTYLTAGFPEVHISLYDMVDPSLMLALISLTGSYFIIAMGGRRSQFIQNSLVLLLIGLMLLFCILSLFCGNFTTGSYSRFFTGGVKGATGFISAIPLAMVAYGGCVVIAFMTSEVKNASKNIPRSLFIGLGVVAFIYAAVIASIVATLPMSVILEDEQLRFIPLFAAISNGELNEYGWLARAVSLCGAVALLTTIIVLLRVNARAIQAIAKEGFLNHNLAGESISGVPVKSISVMCTIAGIMCFFPQFTMDMLMLGAVLNIASMTITCASLIISQTKERREAHLSQVEKSDDGGRLRHLLALARHYGLKNIGAVRRKLVHVVGLWFPAVVIALFWLCYVPDVVAGGSRMWAFTGFVYAVGLLIYVIHWRTASRRVTGVVVRGKGHGHLHGMPTANLQPFEGERLPARGVWAVKVTVNDPSPVPDEWAMDSSNCGCEADSDVICGSSGWDGGAGRAAGAYAGGGSLSEAGTKSLGGNECYPPQGSVYKGMTNVGLRPSDDNSPVVTVETYLLGFSGNLYGREITVEFKRFIRPTRKFANLDELKLQIEKDIEAAGK